MRNDRTGTDFEAGAAGETQALAENRVILRQARRDFLVALEPVRASVYAYCRSLTPTVWDAEDLLQETLTKALAEASQRYEPIRNTQAWLVRIATNTWIDSLRRSSRVTLEWTESALDLPDDGAADPLDSPCSRVRTASAAAPAASPGTGVCGPQGCVLLSPGRDCRDAGDDSRRRQVRPAPRPGHAAGGAYGLCRTIPRNLGARNPGRRRHPGHQALLRRLAAAFNAYDIDAMVSLFLASGRSEVVGNATETGHEEIRAGSLTDTFGPDAAEIHRSTVHHFDGEDIILMWERQKNAPGASEVVSDVLRVRPAFGAPLVAELKWYFFCPEVVAEVAGGLGLPFKTNGVSYF